MVTEDSVQQRTVVFIGYCVHRDCVHRGVESLLMNMPNAYLLQLASIPSAFQNVYRAGPQSRGCAKGQSRIDNML